MHATDEGQKLACRVTAVNGAGKATATSASVTVTGEPLKATGVPVITGTPKEGEQLRCSEGTWNQPIERPEYHWLRDGENIFGATTSEHTIVSQDFGHLLFCQVTAHNSRGETKTATSEGFSVPKGPGVPRNLSIPEVEGSASVGHTLTCNEGVWSGEPKTFVFQWLREGSAIPNAASRSYEVKTADEGHQLQCRVVAENGEGASEGANSEPVRVPGEAPRLVQEPEVVAASSPPHAGESLTCLRGEWKGAPPPTYTYHWYREDAPIPAPAGTSAAYTLTEADRGYEFTCVVTASNGEGSPVAAASRNGIYVPGSAPVPPLEGPTISGTAAVGQTVTCNPGKWGGAPPPIGQRGRLGPER